MATTTVTVNVAESQNYLATSRIISVESATKEAGYITLSTNSVSITGLSGATATVNITSNSGGTLSVRSSNTSKVTASLSGTTITLTGVASGNATITVTVGETSTHTSATATITVTADVHTIAYGTYGVKWTSNVAKGTRTKDATQLAEPQPCLNRGSDGSGSSPFDYIYPWAFMKRVLISCNDFRYSSDVFVKIPKFWYKLSYNSSGYPDIEISSTQKSGYLLSPAHRDRDGQGERDYVYISQSNELVRWNFATLRNYIDEMYGTYAHQYDYALHMTIFLLCAVEMSYMEMGTPIGLGHVDESGTWSYHTGTTASSRTTQGKLRYRNLWGLWDKRIPMDGFYVKNNVLYAIDNPNDYLAFSNFRTVGDYSSTITANTYGFFNGIKIPYTDANTNYFVDVYFNQSPSVGNNIFPHSKYYLQNTTYRPDDYYTFGVYPDLSNNYANQYSPLFSLQLTWTDIGSSSQIGQRVAFTPPNNYSNITSIEEL